MHNYVVDSSQTVPAAKCDIFYKTQDNAQPYRLLPSNQRLDYSSFLDWSDIMSCSVVAWSMMLLVF